MESATAGFSWVKTRLWNTVLFDQAVAIRDDRRER
jgi:hypothetical protein